MRLLKSRLVVDLDALLEVSQYRKDLERITFLRDKTTDSDERERYTNSIAIMQRVLEHLLNEEILVRK